MAAGPLSRIDRVIRAGIELRPVWVRALGWALIASSVLIPTAVLWWRAASPSDADGAPVPPALRPEMVVLPAGTFLMGSPTDEPGRDDDEAQHDVTLTRPFAISRTEVTQGQYRAVTGEEVVTDCSDLEVGEGDELPVVCVTWYDAVRYANALSDLEGLEPAYTIDGDTVTWDVRDTYGYRLPTEAEWEYAARAGSATRYVGTDTESAVCLYANVADAAAKEAQPAWTTFECDDTHPYLSPVTDRQPNAWSLYGFGGNALEWVWDGYEADYENLSSENPEGNWGNSAPTDDRVIRGGSFRGVPRIARAADRDRFEPGNRFDFLGFRLSRSCPSAVSTSGCLPPQAR